MNILFVCTGNISRSFLAEMLLKNQINRLELVNISVASAGLSAYPGHPPDPKMVEYLSESGISTINHKARKIQKPDVDQADLIIVMETAHLKKLNKMWPDIIGKVDLLGKFLSPNNIYDDIVDPFGQSSYHYRLAQSQISLAVDKLANELFLKHSGHYLQK